LAWVILVVPDAMNKKASFVEGEGPRLEALGGPEGLERFEASRRFSVRSMRQWVICSSIIG
jgi:hypothetical protein